MNKTAEPCDSKFRILFKNPVHRRSINLYVCRLHRNSTILLHNALSALQQQIEILLDLRILKSLVIHPATTTHSQMSPQELAEQHITPSTIRLSIGTEHIDDIIADLEKGFAAVRG